MNHRKSSRNAQSSSSGQDPSQQSRSRNLSVDCDSDYEEDVEDDTLDMARRAYNQQLSDAYKDGFREGFDKGQIKLAQAVFNEAHSKAAKSQIPYGQYLGMIKVLESKLADCDDAELRILLDQNSTKETMTKSRLMNRVKALSKTQPVSQNKALKTLIADIEKALSNIN